jgi:dephospho-CoA kinase
MIIVGLTGSIAMGKSETLRMFAELDVPVFDADAEVHALYETDSDLARVVEAAFPGAAPGGRVDRALLSRRIAQDLTGLKQLEAIVHPLVRERRGRFVEACRVRGEALVVLDIPLLLETSTAGAVDRIVVVSAPVEEQRRRALARPGMTEGKLAAILARQMPDAEKRRRADFVVDTGAGLDRVQTQVRAIVATLRREADNARNRA